MRAEPQTLHAGFLACSLEPGQGMSECLESTPRAFQ